MKKSAFWRTQRRRGGEVRRCFWPALPPPCCWWHRSTGRGRNATSKAGPLLFLSGLAACLCTCLLNKRFCQASDTFRGLPDSSHNDKNNHVSRALWRPTHKRGLSSPRDPERVPACPRLAATGSQAPGGVWLPPDKGPRQGSQVRVMSKFACVQGIVRASRVTTLTLSDQGVPSNTK